MLRQVDRLFGDDPYLMSEFKAYFTESVLERSSKCQCREETKEKDGRAEDLETFGHSYPSLGSEVHRSAHRAC